MVRFVCRFYYNRTNRRFVFLSPPWLPTRKRLFSSYESHASPTYFGKVRSKTVVNPSFKIAKIKYGEMKIDTFDMNTSQLLKAASIYARDLLTLNVTSRQERLEPRFAQRTPAAIVPRENLILVSFGSIRAVVGLKDVYILDAHRPTVQDFACEIVKDFQQRDPALYIGDGTISGDESTTKQPYELIFLEGILRDTVDSFNRRARLYDPIVEDFLAKVSAEVYSDTGVHQLVPLKDSLQSFEIQVKQSVDCLAALLDNDDTMLDLLLTEHQAAKESGQEVDFMRHEHVELLLGVYARQLSMTLMEIQFMLGRVHSKLEFVALALDSYRNRMVRINVHLSIAGLSLGVGTTFAGFFGMNLVSGLEHHPWAFYYVTAVTTVGGLAAAWAALNYISGNTMKQRAAKRLEEMETLTGVLSVTCAVDYTIKHARQHKGVGKREFRELLKYSRRSKHVNDREVDLLLHVFDKVKDGVIGREDTAFPGIEQHLGVPEFEPSNTRVAKMDRTAMTKEDMHLINNF